MRYEMDPTLSLKAKGILRFIEHTTKGQTGEVCFEFNMLVGNEGRDSKRNGIKELIKCGYMKSELIRNERGQIEGNKYFVRYEKGLERV